MISIIGWRLAERTRIGVTFHFNSFADDETALAEGNGLCARVGSDYGGVTRERRVDQVAVNHGTRPLDDIYFELKPKSVNLGEIDQEALVAGRPQAVISNPGGAFRLFRIGDAVASRTPMPRSMMRCGW